MRTYDPAVARNGLEVLSRLDQASPLSTGRRSFTLNPQRLTELKARLSSANHSTLSAETQESLVALVAQINQLRRVNFL